MKRKSGFTLVEMLIVVVIIGILSAALIPRLTGYMARTRDIKRQTDLRNIAVAVQRYKNDHGEFPLREVKEPNFSCPVYDCKGIAQRFGYASALSKSLIPYIKEIPTDPKKNLQNNIEWHSPIFGEVGFWNNFWNYKNKNGEYVYLQVSKGGIKNSAALLIAKVENPEYANYITITKFPCKKDNDCSREYSKYGNFAFAHIEVIGAPYMIEKISLCDSLEKSVGNKPTATLEEGRWICKYSSEDQLYYIVKIE